MMESIEEILRTPNINIHAINTLFKFLIGSNYQSMIVFDTNYLSLSIEMKVKKMRLLLTNFHLLLPPQGSKERMIHQ